jgi:hypothetical protein
VWICILAFKEMRSCEQPVATALLLCSVAAAAAADIPRQNPCHIMLHTCRELTAVTSETLPSSQGPAQTLTGHLGGQNWDLEMISSLY